MKSLFIIAALAVSSLPASLGMAHGRAHGTQEAPPKAGTLDSADRKFLNDAAMGGLLEVRLGQLATKQAVNEDVKKFGQRMIDDHTKLNGDLTKFAQQKGVTP